MDGHICFKKKRILSMETLDPRICNEYDKLLHDFNNISVDSNTKLLKEIIDKLNNLENKIDKIITEKDNIRNLENKIDKIITEKDNIRNLENKIDKIITEKDIVHNLENKIDKIFTEKDNIINDLKDELTYFKEELKDLKNYKNNNSKNNDYFC